MSRLLGASLRKSLADVTRRKGRTLLVALGIFIGVCGLTAINVTDDTLVNAFAFTRSEEHTSELQSLTNIVCRLLLEKKKKDNIVGLRVKSRPRKGHRSQIIG